MPNRLILFLVLALCIAGIWAYWNLQAFKASSIRVVATVVERAPGGLWNRTPFAPTIVLKYSYGGKEYQRSTHAISRAYSGLKVGDTIELVLLPKYPGRFMAADNVSS